MVLWRKFQPSLHSVSIFQQEKLKNVMKNWHKKYKEERKAMQFMFIFDCSYSANSPISQKEFVDKTRSFAMSNDCERLDQSYQSRSFFLSTKWWKELENSKFTHWLQKHVFIAELYFIYFIYILRRNYCLESSYSCKHNKRRLAVIMTHFGVTEQLFPNKVDLCW